MWRPNTKSPYSSTIFWERRDELKGLELRQDRDAEAELRWRLAGDSQGRRCKTALVVHDIDAMRSKTAPGRGTKWRGSLNRMQKPPDFGCRYADIYDLPVLRPYSAGDHLQLQNLSIGLEYQNGAKTTGYQSPSTFHTQAMLTSPTAKPALLYDPRHCPLLPRSSIG